MDNEPIKTGAAIAFIKFNRLMGRERMEKMNPDNKKDNANSGNPQGDGTGAISAASTIQDYMLNAKDA